MEKKLYFGENAIENLRAKLSSYGKNVLLFYGGGSIKKNGIYDKVVQILKNCDKNIFEDETIVNNCKNIYLIINSKFMDNNFLKNFNKITVTEN